MLIIRFVSWFSILRATVRVLLAGKELNARPWPELLHKAGLALLQYPCWHTECSQFRVFTGIYDKRVKSLWFLGKAPAVWGQAFLKWWVVFRQIKDIQLILRS